MLKDRSVMLVFGMAFSRLIMAAESSPSPAARFPIETPGPLPVYTPGNAPRSSALEDLTAQSSVSQYGITWFFKRPVLVGRFINGDYYVAGPVTVVKIDPAPRHGREVRDDELDELEKDREKYHPAEERIRNGSMLNPPARREVAWDSGIRSYFNPKLAVHLPMAMQPGDSLVSTISMKLGESAPTMDGYPVRAGRALHDDCPVRIGAVLTCVKGPLAADAFRPGYCDRMPTIHYSHELRRDLLPKLPPFEKAPSLLEAAAQLQRPWLNVGFFGFDEPMQNMPHYGQQVCQTLGSAALLLCSGGAPNEKERLLVNFVQVGMDYWSVIKNGHPGWPAWGGHGSGRKFPILLAGVLLGDDDMARVATRFPKVSFGEDEQTAYGNGWTGATVVFTGHSGIDQATGIGRDGVREGNAWGPYEHLHPSQWTPEQWRSEAYRHANTSSCWVAQALVMRMMGLEKLWNHDAFFDYVDRWMEEDDASFRRVEAKYAPDGYRKDLQDPEARWCHQGCPGEWWIQTVWFKYRRLSSFPEDGWKTPHDDTYYRNAIAKQKTALPR